MDLVITLLATVEQVVVVQEDLLDLIALVYLVHQILVVEEVPAEQMVRLDMVEVLVVLVLSSSLTQPDKYLKT